MTAAVVTLALLALGLGGAVGALAYQLVAAVRRERAAAASETAAIRERDEARAAAAHEIAERTKAEAERARVVVQLTETQAALTEARKENAARVRDQVLAADDPGAVLDGLLSLPLPGAARAGGADGGGAPRRAAMPSLTPTGADAIQDLK